MLFSQNDIGNVAWKIEEAHVNRFLSRRNILILTVFLAAILFSIYFETRPRLAPEQEPLTDIQNVGTLRTQFDQDVGKTRLIVLLSPT
jgi:hypothetical protein